MNYKIKDNEPEHLKEVKRKFEEVADIQERKGIEKYGQPLRALDGFDWLQMALEEQVDGTKYLVAEMEKRKFIISKIRRLTDHEEINFWLDLLEGE